MKEKIAIVTGANGFIGSSLVRRLSKEGYCVYALDREDTRGLETEPNVKMVKCDLENLETIEKSLPKAPHILFHIAWKGISAQDYKDINVQKDNVGYMVNVMNVAINIKCEKIVFVGSNQHYLMAPNSVDNAVGYASVYGATKYACMIIGKTMSLNKIKFNTCSFTNVFGYGDTSKRTANLFINKMLFNEPLSLIEGTHLYDWVYIDDAVSGLIQIAEKGINGKEYYVGSRHLISFKEIILRVKKSLNSSSELNFGIYSDSSFTDYTKFDLEALYEDTGFECQCDFSESIAKTAKWLNERREN